MGKLDANGYLKRVDGTEAFYFEAASESFKLFWAFVKVVRKLAESYPNLIIVIRPHPAEDPASWTTFFKDYSNVLIIREDNISAWVNNSLCVIHHGCTTAIEAEVAGIPIITFVPFEAVTANKISNSFGVLARNEDEVINYVGDLVANPLCFSKKARPKLEAILSIDNENLASQKISMEWSRIEEKIKLNQPHRIMSLSTFYLF